MCTVMNCKNQYMMKQSIHTSSLSDLLQNRCSEEFLKFDTKLPVQESLFNSAAA